MTRLFDIRKPGADEISDAVGLIGRGVAFEKWEPILPLGIREVAVIIGRSVTAALCEAYATAPEGEDPALDTAVAELQQTVAFFTWLKIIPTLDAQHDEAGRGKRLGENEHGLTALQEWKDEENIRRLAHESLDRLVETLDTEAFPFWTESNTFKARAELLIKSKGDFDRYYRLSGHRLFLTIVPIISEIQYTHIASSCGSHMDALLRGDEPEASALGDSARRALALLTMATAMRRLPVELLPEGTVQTSLSQPVGAKLKADREAREATAQSLQEAGEKCLKRLEDAVAELDKSEDADTGDFFTPKPLQHSTGFTF